SLPSWPTATFCGFPTRPTRWFTTTPSRATAARRLSRTFERGYSLPHPRTPPPSGEGSRGWLLLPGIFRPMKQPHRWYLPALALLVAVSGCSGPLVKVSGRLTYKGQPVPSTYVHFWPEEEGKRESVGLTDDDGHYKLSFSRTEEGVYRGR